MALYLKELELTNVRGFRHVRLDFEQDGKRRDWTIVLGANGHGKTTILRAIALGLADEKTTSELLSLLPGDLIRRNKRGRAEDEATIRVALRSTTPGRKTYEIKTRVTRDPHGSERVRKEFSEGLDPHELFVCGYGSNRGVSGRSHSAYELRNSLLSLFNDRAGLLEPEGVLRDFRLRSFEREQARRKKGRGAAAKKGPKEPDAFRLATAMLRKVWGLGSNYPIEVESERVLVAGPWGRLPFHVLGDGYRGTGAWLLDLLGNSLKAGRWRRSNPLKGIVLLDEMDEHLHPRWQRELLPLLRKVLPHMQFVATTHSPLSLVNARSDELRAVTLRHAVAELLDDPLPSPGGRTVNELLLGEWFGLESILDQDSERLLEKYRRAFEAGRDDEAEALRPALERKIQGFLVSPLDRLARDASRRVGESASQELSASERERIVEEAARELRKQISRAAR